MVYMVSVYSHALYILIVFSYGIYVCITSYTITVKGLKNLYRIFMLHLFLILLVSPVGILRPEEKLFDNISWTNSVLCHSIGRFFCFYISFQPFLITMFSYYRTSIYTELASGSNRLLIGLRNAMKFALVIAFICCLVILGICRSGSQLDGGIRKCLKVDHSIICVFVIGGALFILVNGACMFVFCKFRNLADERPEIKNLDNQIRRNSFLFPLMHLITTLVYIIQYYMQTYESDKLGYYWYHVVWYHMVAVDQLSNSVLMYLCIFGKGFGDFIPNIEYSFDDSDLQNHIVPALGVELDAEIWLSFPGAHPICVSEELVYEMDCWDNVITSKRRLRQIKRYRMRGRIPELFNCYDTPESFANECERRGVNHDLPYGGGVLELNTGIGSVVTDLAVE